VLDAAGTPLTEAQGKSLIAALSTEHRHLSQLQRDAMAQGTFSTADMMNRHAPERRQRMLDAAAPHLSPQQLEGYRGMLERAAAQEESMRATIQRATEAAAALPR
jgi:hypothetical protein